MCVCTQLVTNLVGYAAGACAMAKSQKTVEVDPGQLLLRGPQLAAFCSHDLGRSQGQCETWRS